MSTDLSLASSENKKKDKRMLDTLGTVPEIRGGNVAKDTAFQAYAKSKGMEVESKDAMKKRVSEFSRRTQALDEYRAQGEGASGGSTRRFTDIHVPEQRWALFNIGHRGHNPKSKRPCFRFIGFFESPEKAKDHYEYILKPAGIQDCALHGAPAGKKVLLCKTLRRQKDSRYVLTKIKIMTEKYLRERSLTIKEFKMNHEMQKQGKVGLSQLKRAAQRKRKDARESAREAAMRSVAKRKDREEAELEITQEIAEPRDLPVTCLVRNQNFLVISVITDNTSAAMKGREDPEPMVIFWRAFSTDSDARAYVQSVGARLVRDIDMDIVEVGEWLFPEDVDREKIAEGYRHTELGNIMEGRKKARDDLLDFEAWCKQENMDVPSTEIDVDTGTGETKVKETDFSAGLKVTTRDTRDPDAKEVPLDPKAIQTMSTSVRMIEEKKQADEDAPKELFDMDALPENLLGGK